MQLLSNFSPVIVESDADVEKAAQRIAEGKWLNSGQTCLAPDYVMTTPELKPKLVQALQKSVHAMYGQDPQKSGNYSRMVNQQHFDRVKAMLDKSKGQVLFQAGEPDRDDVYIPPVLVDTNLEDSLMQEEVFGPVLPILTVNGLQEAIDVINDGEKVREHYAFGIIWFINLNLKPLGAYLFTADSKKVDKFLHSTSSGGLLQNTPNTVKVAILNNSGVTVNDILKHVTVTDLPFGGVGTSGMGSYHGKHGFMQMSHAKAVLKRRD
jgi:aldehyde dehydrogenase (NAD+)